MMTFTDAKACQKRFADMFRDTSEQLRNMRSIGPDHEAVARMARDAALGQLQTFNAWFFTRYAKELRGEDLLHRNIK